MRTKRRRKILIVVASVAGAILIVGGIAIAVFNPRLTRYVESAEFRAELEKQTAKGLHFSDGDYAPIRRTGFLSVASDRFQAQDGRKAMTSLDAHDISGRFNPLGVFLRRWQLDELRIDHGEVGIQIYEPKPEPSPAKPWYHVFLPDRVYLKRVSCEPADVTWQMRGKKGGIFQTRLVITPHGRDFEYRATGGTLKNALIPDLELRRTHMLITKKLFTLYELELGSGSGRIQGEGTAETRGEKEVDFKLKWHEVPVGAWLPKSWSDHVVGTAEGNLHWTGHDFKIETAKVDVAIRILGGQISGLQVLEQLAAIAKRPELKRLNLNTCAADFNWDKERGELKNITIEEEEKFRIEGNVSFASDSLGGTLQLGVKRAYLEWLPNPEEIFSGDRDGYLWTTVHLSGTLDSPQQDLSPRLVEALAESPFDFVGAALRAVGVWLRGE